MPQIPDASTIALINRDLPTVIEAIAAEPTVKEIAEGRDGELLSACAQATVDRRLDTWRITMGLGGSTSRPAARILNYAILIGALVDRLQRLDLGNPSVRIFKADHLAARINGYDLGAMSNVTEQTFSFLRSFLDAFFPFASPHIQFVRDDADGINSIIDSVVAPLAERLPVMPEIASLARGRSSSLDAMAYALCHPIQLETLMPQDASQWPIWNENDPATQKRFVLTVGGYSERLFLPILDLAAVHFDASWIRQPRAHLISSVGRKPAYFPVDGEPLIGEPVTPKRAHELACHEIVGTDWRAITRDDGRLSDVLDFLAHWKE